MLNKVTLSIVEAATELVKQLSLRFPSAALMDALGLIYPQYWQEEDAEKKFEKHLPVIKQHYNFSTSFSTTGELVFSIHLAELFLILSRLCEC
jgi:hypothetical protein